MVMDRLNIIFIIIGIVVRVLVVFAVMSATQKVNLASETSNSRTEK